MVPEPALLDPCRIADLIDVGTVVVDAERRVVLWNRFMVARSGVPTSEVKGRPLLEARPELPRAWLGKKLDTVFLLKASAFSSWRERPHVFRLRHDRPVTGGAELMYEDLTFIPVLDAGGEVGHVAITIRDMTEVALSETRLAEALARIEELSLRDPLTGAFNRRRLEDVLSVELARCQRYGAPCAFVLFDLDHFKRVNDTFGHPAGDEVLRVVASALMGMVRTTDLVARYGGEEFALLLPATDLEHGVLAAERFRGAVEALVIPHEGHELRITASLGVAAFVAGDDGASLIAAADAALYESKAGGRNRVTAARR